MKQSERNVLNAQKLQGKGNVISTWRRYDYVPQRPYVINSNSNNKTTLRRTGNKISIKIR